MNEIYTVKVAIVLPALQAVVFGALVGLLALCGCIYLGLPWALAPIAGLSLALILFSKSLGDWRILAGFKAAPTLEVEPKEREYALDGPNLVRIEVAEQNGRKLEYYDLPATQQQLSDLANGLLSGRTLTEVAWCGPGRTFTRRAEYVALRDELIRRGLACWNSASSPARGCSLTLAGRNVMKHLV